MSRDPAFLFYPSDFLTGVSGLTMEERGQYITLLCLQHQTGALTDKTIRLTLGSVSVDVLSKFYKNEIGNYVNKRLELEIEKRMQFVDSRRVNGKKGGRPPKPLGYPNGKPTENLLEDENINRIILQLETKNNISIVETEKKYFMFLVAEMSRLFLEKNTEYYFDKETDYHACLQIAYRISELKKWAKHEVVNGKMNDCLDSWKKIVEFVSLDDWLKTRSLSDLSTVKEFQRLIQKMSKNGTDKKSATDSGTKLGTSAARTQAARDF